MKPFWRSKKLWTAVIALVALVVAEATGRHELVEPITALGIALVAGFGLADLGKERAALALAATRAEINTRPSEDVHEPQ